MFPSSKADTNFQTVHHPRPGLLLRRKTAFVVRAVLVDNNIVDRLEAHSTHANQVLALLAEPRRDVERLGYGPAGAAYQDLILDPVG